MLVCEEKMRITVSIYCSDIFCRKQHRESKRYGFCHTPFRCTSGLLCNCLLRHNSVMFQEWSCRKSWPYPFCKSASPIYEIFLGHLMKTWCTVYEQFILWNFKLSLMEFNAAVVQNIGTVVCEEGVLSAFTLHSAIYCRFRQRVIP
jgi:hypothetical protein